MIASEIVASSLDPATELAPLPELATPPEAAAFLRTTVNTLRWWRQQGTGPAYVKSGARILYPRESLHAWLASGEETTQ